MAGLLRKRKGKAVTQSSNEVPRFKTLFHEAHYKSKLSTRNVLQELIIQVDESILDPCGFQIQQRKWEMFTSPIQAVGHLMANKDYRLEHVLEDLCIEGADWVRHKDGRPHYLRRADLESMTKSWYDFICRSILPTTNRSELTVEKAVLVHSIIIGENINVEENIADQIYKFVNKTDLSSSLPFPSIIAALCVDAKIPAIKDDTWIPQEPPIMRVTMTRTRETRERNPRQARQEAPQCNHNHKFTNNKISLQASTHTLTPLCHRFIGGLINNKKKVGGVLRPSTQGWIAWMTS
ncbi:hypothetical protein PIB30_049756 [Stylosanthes scabra]|uniref:Putative plant transposon protein domain-containing protein n=1 Tax=Stylosanthes scabra TaxID=79078 RepID=A0ABU6WJD7_9FABA|nr:hypothetical protein [Stylosanthes scabra]